jgi:hypothetical protein
LIDHSVFMDLLDIPAMDMLQRSHRGWVDQFLSGERSARDSNSSESIAVGNKAIVAMVKKQLGLRAKGRKITGPPDECQLRETQLPYGATSGGENGLLSLDNLHFWEVYPLISDAWRGPTPLPSTPLPCCAPLRVALVAGALGSLGAETGALP